jgi:hypothetical protein
MEFLGVRRGFLLPVSEGQGTEIGKITIKNYVGSI